MKASKDLAFLQWCENRRKSQEPAAQAAKEEYCKYKAEVEILYEEAFIKFKAKILAENTHFIFVRDILKEIPIYKDFFNFCKTNSGAGTLLTDEIINNTSTILTQALYEEIMFSRTTEMKIYILNSDFENKILMVESIETKDNSQLLLEVKEKEIAKNTEEIAIRKENELLKVDINQESLQQAKIGLGVINVPEAAIAVHSIFESSKLKRKNEGDPEDIIKKPEFELSNKIENKDSLEFEVLQKEENEEDQESLD